MGNRFSKFKKSAKRTFKKRTTFKVPKKAALYNNTLGKLGVGFPKKLQFTHKYMDSTTLTSTLGVMANYRIRTNGLLDPNATAAGHGCSYYNSLKLLYDKWLVIGSKIDVMFIPQSTALAGMACGLAINDNLSTTPLTYVQYGEASNCKVKYLSTGAVVPSKLTMNWSARKAFGGSLMSNNELSGDVLNDPVEQQIFNIFLQATDQASTVSVNIVIRVTYIAIWYELLDLVTS